MITLRRSDVISRPRRSGSFCTVGSAALVAVLASFGSVAARAVDDPEAEARINETLAGLPPDQIEAALRENFDPGIPSVVTESYAISPASLRALDSAGNKNFFNSYAGFFVTEGAFWGCMYAPLHLPRGATVTGLVMWFVDVGTGWFAADIRRKSITTTAVAQVMGSVSSTAGAGIRFVLDATINNGVIDNDNYVYYAQVCPSSSPGEELHGLYIIYNR